MGLGSLLLHSAPTAPYSPPPPATPPPASEPESPAAEPRSTEPSPGEPLPGEPEAERRGASYILLWPALGCPQMVDPERRELEIIFLAKQEVDDDHLAKDLCSRLRVLTWSHATAAYRSPGAWSDLLQPQNRSEKARPLSDYMDSTEPRLLDRRALAEYRDEVRERPVRLGESVETKDGASALLHTIADAVPEVYGKQGFNSIASLRLTLREDALTSGVLYTLYYPPENGLLRHILRDPTTLQLPYDDIPLIDGTFGGPAHVFRGRGEAHDHKYKGREHLVRLFHPFAIGPAETVKIGHLTDPHICTLWDFFQQQIDDRASAEPPFEDMKERFNNPNHNVARLLRRLAAAEADMVLLTGDLIDFARGFDHRPAEDYELDYVFNLNWLRYYELLLTHSDLPTWSLLGNHDWRLNPYPPRFPTRFSIYCSSSCRRPWALAWERPSARCGGSSPTIPGSYSSSWRPS